MRKYLVISFITVFLFTLSCKNDDKDDLIVNLNNSGNLKIKLVDNSGTALSGIDVRMYTFGTNWEEPDYEKKATDATGIVDFGKVLSAWYTIQAKGIDISGQKYAFSKNVQVLAGDENPIELNPQNYIGKFTFYVNSSQNNIIAAVPQINVALINYSDYSSELSHSELLNLAYSIGKTDDSGKVIFDGISAKTSFKVYVYFDETHASFVSSSASSSYSSSYSVDIDEEETNTVYVAKSKIYDLKGNLNLHVQWYGYDGSNYGYHPASNVNTVLITRDDYQAYNLSSSEHSVIMTHSKYSGITDADGNILFSNVKAGVSYKVYVYYSETLNSWDGSYSSIACGENTTNSFDVNVNGEDLGLDSK